MRSVARDHFLSGPLEPLVTRDILTLNILMFCSENRPWHLAKWLVSEWSKAKAFALRDYTV